MGIKYNEIDKIIVELIMGWEYKERIHESDLKCNGKPLTNIIESIITPDGNEFSFLAFNPSFDMNQTWLMVEKLREKGVFLDLTTGEDEYIAELTEIDYAHADNTGITRFNSYTGNAEKPALAICLAVMEYLGIVVEVEE